MLTGVSRCGRWVMGALEYVRCGSGDASTVGCGVDWRWSIGGSYWIGVYVGFICEQRSKWSDGVCFVVVEDDHVSWDKQGTFSECSSGSHDL